MASSVYRALAGITFVCCAAVPLLAESEAKAETSAKSLMDYDFPFFGLGAAFDRMQFAMKLKDASIKALKNRTLTAEKEAEDAEGEVAALTVQLELHKLAVQKCEANRSATVAKLTEANDLISSLKTQLDSLTSSDSETKGQVATDY